MPHYEVAVLIGLLWCLWTPDKKFNWLAVAAALSWRCFILCKAWLTGRGMTWVTLKCCHEVCLNNWHIQRYTVLFSKSYGVTFFFFNFVYSQWWPEFEELQELILDPLRALLYAVCNLISGASIEIFVFCNRRCHLYLIPLK